MKDKILRGPRSIHRATMGLGEYFWRAAEKYGDRICQIDAYTHKKESFDKVRKRSVKVALALRKMGLQKNDTVMICCKNNLDTVIPLIAASFLGASACFVEPLMEAFDVKNLLTQANPKVIFVVDTKVDMIEEAIKQESFKPKICVIGKSLKYHQMYDMENTINDEETSFQPLKVNVTDTALIVFSSGTTSMPKGVLLSHLSVMSPSCHHDINIIPLIDEPLLQYSSFFWISGIWTFTFCIVFGQPRLVGENITAMKFIELVDLYKMPHAFLYGQILYDLVNIDKDILDKYNLSCVKTVSMGGSFVDPGLIISLRKIFTEAMVAQAYGATEIGVPTTQWIGSDKVSYENKVSSVGRPSWNIEIKVVDVNTNEPLGPNQEGEILVKSPYKLNGFCCVDAATIFDEDGFIKTRDLGYYDEDGYIYIIDRLNDIFKARSHRIAPSIIEAVLLKHPAIKETVVFGIPHSTEYNRAAAYIVLKENMGTTAEEILDFVKTNMSEIYTLRGGIKFLDVIPKTINGKVSRCKLQKMFLSSETNLRKDSRVIG